MKKLLAVALTCLVALNAFSQTETPKHHRKNGTNNTANAQSPTATPAPDPAAAQEAQVALFQKSFVPTDPWRIANDHTNYAKGADWVQFEGKVLSVSGDGIELQGWFGDPLGYMLPTYASSSNQRFFLSNYPRHVAVGQLLSRYDRLVAMKSGTKNDIQNLDYETVWVPQLTDEQKAAVAQSKTSTDARVLAFHKELAEKGDAYGEYKMGMRYLNGDGVDKDPAKARDLLTKSAAQGNKDASDALAKLPAN